MKRLLLSFLLTALSFAGLHAESFNPADTEPLMEDRALLLNLAKGTRQARLQVKDENGEWSVFSLAHLAGDEGFLKLRVPDDVLLEDCRAEVAMTDPFPYSFYQGSTKFEQASATGGANRGGGPEVAFDAGAPEADGQGGSPDVVQESDLWQWRGDTLYFFNQQRGLQVFDLSEPETPKKLATLRMPAVGDQMYVLDDEHVLLLANYVNYSAYGWWDFRLPYSSVQQTEAIVVKHSGDTLEVVNRVAVDGDYLESRLVGNRLYLVSRIHQPKEDEEGGFYWRQGLQVNSINFSNPNAPTLLEPLELVDQNGWFWNSVVTASPDHLLVTTSHYDDERELTRSRVHVIPISRTLTSMEVAHTVDLKANLPDKFKLRMKEDILTTVTQKNVWRRELTTYVESFDLSGDEAEKLDEIILAPQERLHATRFDGDRLYVVTFFVEIRKDPLFVIDLSDPGNLKSLGELEIPGWSTYLVPEGDRLLSVGVEEDRVAISLFDVSDPSRPSLKQRVYPGEGRSWSEANWDEKAVGYLPGKNLLLLPISTRVKGEEGYEYKNLMQIVDVREDALEVRGAIEHEVQGRRATAVGDTVVSISGQEMIVVDATDRDEPDLLTEVSLAWNVAHVVEIGDSLWQIENGQSWQSDIKTRVRITDKEDFDSVKTDFYLEPGAVAGLHRVGSKLYVGRYRQWNEKIEVPGEENPFPDGEEPEAWEPEPVFDWVRHNEFSTDVIDVSDPMEPSLLGSVTHDLGKGYQIGGLMTADGSFVNGHLVWRPKVTSNRYWGGWFFDDIAIAADIDFGWGGGGYWGGYSYYDSVSILAVNVDDPAEPFIASATVIDPKDSVEFGPMIVQDERLLLSYKRTTYFETKEGNNYLNRYHLRDVSFADPAHPVVNNAVSLPGMLEGVVDDNGGLVLISTAPKYAQNDQRHWFESSNSVLQASVYDGTQAYLVTEVTALEGRYTSTVVLNGQIYKTGEEDKKTGLLLWAWKNDGDSAALVRDGFIELESTPNNLVVHEGLLFMDYNDAIGVARGGDVTNVTLSGPVYTQNLSQIDVNDEGTFAWLAVGSYGVEPLDLSGLSPVSPAFAVAAQGEGFAPANKALLYYVRASGEDFVGELRDEDIWRFRASGGLVDYAEWAAMHFNPTGESDWTMVALDEDADLDGASNAVEFLYGTSPLEMVSKRNLSIRLDLETDSVSLQSDVFDQVGEKNVRPVVEESADLLKWSASDYDPDSGRMERGEEDQTFYRVRFELAE